MDSLHIDLELWSLGISGDEYTYIRIACFADTIHDTAHDSYMERFEGFLFRDFVIPTIGRIQSLRSLDSSCFRMTGIIDS